MAERQTKAKSALRDLLASSKKPLSVMDLMDLLSEKGVFVNKTTVYREIERLIYKGEVAEVHFADKQTRYEMTHGDHHHHAVCTGCKTVIELEIEPELERLQKIISRNNGFVIRKHLVEFFGLCQTCHQ